MKYEKGLSIVIPYYNSYETIERCVLSTVTNKTEVEIIIIDDFSQQGCDKIINKLILPSNITIKLIRNQNNLGAGESRNRGIKEATKEYITFVDSDDELSADFYDETVGYMDDHFDQIVFDAEKYTASEREYICMYYSNTIGQGTVPQKENLVYIKGSTWGKVYRNDIIQQNHIAFGNIKRNEDLIFSKIAASYTNKIIYISKPLYKYINNPNSLMNNASLKTPDNAVIAFKNIQDRLIGREFEKEINSILFLELLYATTVANIVLGKTRKEIITTYRKYRSQYDRRDKYRKGYNMIYRASFFLFETGLFKTYGRLRAFLMK